jgi:hypothetical protein
MRKTCLFHFSLLLFDSSPTHGFHIDALYLGLLQVEPRFQRSLTKKKPLYIEVHHVFDILSASKTMEAFYKIGHWWLLEKLVRYTSGSPDIMTFALYY